MIGERRPSPAFWSGRKVLVTGHAGFKGDWLVRVLLTLGARVAGYGLEPTGWSHERLAVAHPNLTSRSGNILDFNSLQSFAHECRPEVIFHLAAQALVSVGHAKPSSTFETNVMGTVNISTIADSSEDVKILVNITSDKVYENTNKQVQFRESDALGGKEPYALSKACAELVSRAYAFRAMSRGNRAILTARAGNIMGGNDWSPNRIVPDIARAHISGTPLVIRNPSAVRPWQHVMDVASGYLLLAESFLGGQPERDRWSWNFGPAQSSAVTVGELAMKFQLALGGSPSIVISANEHDFLESDYLMIDSRVAKAELGWCPKLTLQDSVSTTASWYTMFHSGRLDSRFIESFVTKYLDL